MEKIFRYQKPGVHLEYYRLPEDQSSAPPPGMQPVSMDDLLPVRTGDTLTFADGEVDIRGFVVNTPKGDALGHVSGFLADARHGTVPFTIITLGEDGQEVVVQTGLLTRYPENGLVVFSLGKPALMHAPKATYDVADAAQAIGYWSEFIRRNAA